MNLERKNPITILCYLFFVIFITIFSTNPIMLGISFVSSILFYFALKGWKKTLIRLAYSLLFVAIITLVNPLFSRQGMTALFEIGSLIVTEESILYGVAIGVMFSSSMIWFGAMNILLDSDKISYIFGKYTPKIGTILSVSLGLFPKYIAQYKKIDNNLKALGLYNQASLWRKIKLKMHTLSTLISWSIEGALILSDSMSARGYDLKHKRVFCKYHFGVSDIILLIISIAVGIVILVFMGLGVGSYYFYPTFKPLQWDVDVWIYFATFCFMNLMLTVDLWEMIKWQFSISKI